MVLYLVRVPLSVVVIFMLVLDKQQTTAAIREIIDHDISVVYDRGLIRKCQLETNRKT